MRRFSRLEFGDTSGEGQDKKARGEEIRDAEYFHKEALRYRLAGDFEMALRHYSRCLEQSNVFFPAWLGQVEMLIELGEYKEAAVWADKAMTMFPEHPELLSAKAVACVRDARLEKATAYSDSSVTKDNVTARVWLARAEVMFNRKSRIALNCISKALAAAGEDGLMIRLEAGRLLIKMRDYGGAIRLLGTIVEELPDSALAWYELGRCQAGLGRPEAGVSFEQAIKLHPEWPLANEALKKFNTRGFLRKLFGR